MGGEHLALSPFSRLPPPLSLPQPGSLLPSSCVGGREGQDCLETEGSPFSHICLRRHRAWGRAPFQALERLFTVHCQRPLWKTGHPGAAGERGRGEGERREGSWGEGGDGELGSGRGGSPLQSLAAATSTSPFASGFWSHLSMCTDRPWKDAYILKTFS